MPDVTDQRGQAVPLVLVSVLLAALVALGVAQLGDVAARRAHAQAAADATALAGAAAGEAEAAQLAAANDAQLVSFTEGDDGVAVQVARDGVVADARARWVARPIP